MKNETHLYKQINKTLPVLFIIFSIYTAVMPENIFATKVNKTAFGAKTFSQNDFDKKFREGRDLIDKEEWAKAAEKFNEVVGRYPNNKSTDVALYWLAFCQKKQNQFKETEATLDRLIKEFPTSSWTSDARVMKVEIGRSLGKVYSPSAEMVFSVPPNGVYTSAVPNNNIKAATALSLSKYYESTGFGETSTLTSLKTPLDREDEIKIAAFQSLLSADPKRAIETMGDIIKSDSKASEILKVEVLHTLRNLRQLPALSGNLRVFSSGVSKEFMPLLKETLVKSFKNESNVKIRKELIYSLANLNDDQSIEYIAQLYATESDKEIKKAIINSFAGQPNGFYTFNSNIALGGGNSNRKIEFDKLLEIARTEKDTELRRLALSTLQHSANWSANTQIVDTFSQIYDSETDEQFKLSIIRTLANSKQNQATKKLLDIAKNDKSDKLKLEAIFALRMSNNAEVLKFLEDLIK